VCKAAVVVPSMCGIKPKHDPENRGFI